MRDDYVLNITTYDGHGYSAPIQYYEWNAILEACKNKELNGFEVPFEMLGQLWPKHSVEKVVVIKVK